MVDLTGQTLLNRYHVQSLVGRGGMADVYKVFDQEQNHLLALKLLRSELAQDHTFVDFFKREAQNLSLLQHPNIVHCYGLEEQEGMVFLLMDFVSGGSLQNEIFDAQGIGISPQRSLEILRPICYALAYAHEQGLIHCDIKPTNILHDKDEQWLLSDFGIARLAGEAGSVLAGVGTPEYMAPEQIAGEKITPQADIFSLGVLLFEMLTGGVRPFTGEHCSLNLPAKDKIRWEQLNREMPLPRQYKAGIAKELEAVVSRCMCSAPDQRYHSALDLLVALEAAVTSTPASLWEIPAAVKHIPREPKGEKVAPPTDPFGGAHSQEKTEAPLRGKSSAPRRRSIWLAGALVMLALVFLTGSAFYLDWLPVHGFSADLEVPQKATEISVARPVDTQKAAQTTLPTSTEPSKEAPASDGKSARVLAVEGQAFYQDAAQKTLELIAGQDILVSEGTRVWTSSGQTRMMLERGEMVYLGQNTTVIIRFLPGSEAGETLVGLRLERGSILIETQDQPMTVESTLQLYWGGPGAQSIAGVVYDPIQEYFWVDCLAGKCLLGSGIDITDVPEGTRSGYGKDILRNTDLPAYEFWMSLAGNTLRQAIETPVPTISPAAILYAEDFEGDKVENWDAYVGEWSIKEDGSNHFWNGTGPDNYPQAWIRVDTSTWTDYAFESRIRFNSGTVFICFRSDEQGDSFYNAALSSEDWVAFADYDGKEYKSFGEKDISISLNQWYTVRLEVQGNQLRFYLDGKLITSATRNTHSQGGIGYYMGGGDEIQIDDIKVWMLEQ